MKNIKELFQKIKRIEMTTTRLVEELMQGAYRSAFKGQGLEFVDVRPYQPGDDIRSIDWNVTARSSYPYIKTFNEERELTVFLLIDLSASSRYGIVKKSKKELIAEIVSMLAFSAIKNNDKVGAILFSNQVEKYIPPKKGTRHVLRVIHDLLELPLKGKKTDIGHALEYFIRVQKKTAVCFLISDFLTEKTYETPLKLVAKKHDLIAIAINDQSENSIPQFGLANVSDLETGTQMVIDFSDSIVRKSFLENVQERRDTVREIMGKLRAGFIELETSQPYETAFQRYFKKRKIRQ